MLKTLCVVAATAFHPLPLHLRPQPCITGGLAMVNPDNSVTFEGATPAAWSVTIGPNRKILKAIFNGRAVR